MAAMGLVMSDGKKRPFLAFKSVLEAMPDDTKDGFLELNIEASPLEVVGVIGPFIEDSNDAPLTFLKRVLLAQLAPPDQETTETSDSDSDHGPCN
jgi:hypothetical protein